MSGGKQVVRHARSGLRRLAERMVGLGASPAWFGYRGIREMPVQTYLANAPERTETLHPPTVAENALPVNVPFRDSLPRDRGWWGYSFWDVPERESAESFLATLPDATVVPVVKPQNDQFYPAILARGQISVALREIRFHPEHEAALRDSPRPVRMRRATWILERVYDNHSHWLTAHVPKLVLLRDRGELDGVVLPQKRSAVMDASLRQLGLDPVSFPTFNPARPVVVDELTVLGTDRFRPELLQSVRTAFANPEGERPRRRLYISRAKAPRRRLLNEDEVWPVLQRAGFERVFLEDHPFQEQVRLMQEAAVVVAPHGAGLTNILFCEPETHVVEIADWSFPNPNFYAVAAAMGHHYWIVRAEGTGDVRALEQDLVVRPGALEEILPRILDGGRRCH